MNWKKYILLVIIALIFIIITVSIYQLTLRNVTHKNNNYEEELYNYRNPVIPEGFHKLETDTASWEIDSDGIIKGWNDGLVIEDDIGNQFVWVPCTIDGNNETVKYSRYIIDNDILVTESDEKLYPSRINQNKSSYFVDNDPINEEIRKSIEKYQGFYIGRYETGIENGDLLPITNNYDELSFSLWENGNPVVKSNSKVWNYITQKKAKEVSQNFISSKNIQSQLMTSFCFDTTIKWISNDIADFANNSQKYGNYENIEKDDFENILTGTSNKYMYKNIYDIAGNMREFTTESNITNNTNIYSKLAVFRENYYFELTPDNTNSCFSRIGIPNNWYNIACSFRIILFIKTTD